jgi:hypothetical protein
LPAETSQRFEPDLPAIGAVNQEVINGLDMLGAKGTTIIILESMSAFSFHCLALILYGKPNEHATFVWGPYLPQFFCPI